MKRLSHPWALIALQLVVATCLAPIFYWQVVGDASTNFWSVFFGVQWVFLAATTLVLLIIGMLRKSQHILLVVLLLAVTLSALYLPAMLSQKTRRYITGDGGPAGPVMNCLGWEDIRIFKPYNQLWKTTCLLASLPSYSKFWIDQRQSADQSDSSATYYVMFLSYEALLLAGSYLALKKMRARQ